jgi:FtsP/CotA-like multicopper oxidase with cupredoxin domain
MSSHDLFRTETAGLPGSQPTAVVSLSDGDVFDLHVSPVVKQLGDSAVRMLAYNGSVPGPALRVRQGSEVVVNVVNDGDLDATVHWHGLRLTTARWNPQTGTRSRWAGASQPGSSSRTRASTGITRIRQDYTGDGPVRHHPGGPDRPGLPGRLPTARSSSPWMTLLLENGKVARSAGRRRRIRRWAASVTCCS